MANVEKDFAKGKPVYVGGCIPKSVVATGYPSDDHSCYSVREA